MAPLLGVDAGGTYTDAVVIADGAARGAGLLAKAKALTTRPDPTTGVFEAIDAALDAAGVAPEKIALASLATTHATNALVEGVGGRVGLAFIGFTAAELARPELSAALQGDPAAVFTGGHGSYGDPQAPLDETALRAWAEATAPRVSGFAVAAQFGVRNPAHELRAREILRDAAGLPVTCSHELTAKLGGPRRALTAVLNARLIGVIQTLVDAMTAALRARGVVAPLMLVRGDGALMSAATAGDRPIETILSGPAASLVGAAHLTDRPDAIVSDIGGTTTDVAVLRAGVPKLDPQGARVGGHQTLVEAAAARTTGLGGDSEFAINESFGRLEPALGPRRAVPISLLATRWGDPVRRALEAQLESASHAQDARFALTGDAARTASATEALPGRAQELLAELGPEPIALKDLLSGERDRSPLEMLRRRGLIRVAAFTPTDALHALGRHTPWDAEAATLAADLLARRRALLTPFAPDGATLSEGVLAMLTARSAAFLLDVALAEDGYPEDAEAPLSASALGAAALSGRTGLVAPRIAMTVPIVALGASAGAHYPPIAKTLGTEVVVPADADVAGAVGAVVGQVRVRREVVVQQPSDGVYAAAIDGEMRSFADLEAALSAAEDAARSEAIRAATAAGAEAPTANVQRDLNWAEIEGRASLIEARVAAVATGRPRLGAA